VKAPFNLENQLFSTKTKLFLAHKNKTIRSFPCSPPTEVYSDHHIHLACGSSIAWYCRPFTNHINGKEPGKVVPLPITLMMGERAWYCCPFTNHFNGYEPGKVVPLPITPMGKSLGKLSLYQSLQWVRAWYLHFSSTNKLYAHRGSTPNPRSTRL